jgi:hypothetical protein
MVRTYVHPVLPGSEAVFIPEKLLIRPLLKTSADLPGAQSRELDNEDCADQERQPGR